MNINIKVLQVEGPSNETRVQIFTPVKGRDCLMVCVYVNAIVKEIRFELFETPMDALAFERI